MMGVSIHHIHGIDIPRLVINEALKMKYIENAPPLARLERREAMRRAKPKARFRHSLYFILPFCHLLRFVCGELETRVAPVQRPPKPTHRPHG